MIAQQIEEIVQIQGLCAQIRSCYQGPGSGLESLNMLSADSLRYDVQAVRCPDCRISHSTTVVLLESSGMALSKLGPSRLSLSRGLDCTL
jgi:hypothetical protein